MTWKSLGRLFSGIKGAYNDINPATLTGAIDVIVVQQRDGSFKCGPFYVRFGKLTAFSPADKIVEVYVNGEFVEFLHMRLSNYGDAYFVDSDGNDTEETFGQLNSQIQDAIRDKSWSNLPKRKWRRKIRRDSAMSEPDSASEFMEKHMLASEGDQYDILSDCEAHQDLMVSGIMNTDNYQSVSDSRLTGSQSYLENDFHWDWVQCRISDSAISASASTEGSNTRAMSTAEHSTEGKFEAVKDRGGGLYLEDLVTSDVDQNVKEAYIYPSTRMNLRAYEGNCIDNGYRSDNEQSTRSLSPANLNTFRLSLCGGLSAEASISETKFLEHMVSYEEFIRDPHSILTNPNLVIYLNGRYCTWQVAAPSLVSLTAFQAELPYSTMRRLENLYVPKKQSRLSAWFSWRASHVQTLDSAQSACPNSDDLHRYQNTSVNNSDYKCEQPLQKTINFKKIETKRLNSADIARLNLKAGRNDVEFRVTTKYQGTCTCSASIFYWHWYDRIVVSDVDGTITKSDLLGHLLPMLGRDWTHDGVARLYSKITNNGYKFLYLSARALGQAGITRSYLRQVVQNSGFTLPDGPILLSPSSLLHAFHQEVIINKPEQFKTKCLHDVCDLFPPDLSPLYSGFGNKVNDVCAYQSAGIERHCIFTIRPSGIVRNEYQCSKNTSYEELADLVDYIFPYYKTMDYSITNGCNDQAAVMEKVTKLPSLVSNKETSIDRSMFSSFTFWRNMDFELSFTPVESPETTQNV